MTVTDSNTDAIFRQHQKINSTERSSLNCFGGEDQSEAFIFQCPWKQCERSSLTDLNHNKLENHESDPRQLLESNRLNPKNQK